MILLIPNYLITSRLGWLDTLAAVIVPGAAGAFGVFFMRQFFLGLPRELEEAAAIDGAGPFPDLPDGGAPPLPAGPRHARRCWRSSPTGTTSCGRSTCCSRPENQTLPAGLATLQNANAVRYDLLMAGAVIASVPVLVLYAAAQRFVVEGVSRAGLKG